jgi:hypothetical protein
MSTWWPWPLHTRFVSVLKDLYLESFAMPTGFILGVVGDHMEHRAENLFLGDRHIILYIDKQSRG